MAEPPVVSVTPFTEEVVSVAPDMLGAVPRTTVEPDPVVVPAISAVPFPARTGELTVVDRVIAGVVVGLATLPANPLAVATETEVTVPEALALSVRRRPVTESMERGRTVDESALETPPAAGIKLSSLRSVPAIFNYRLESHLLKGSHRQEGRYLPRFGRRA